MSLVEQKKKKKKETKSKGYFRIPCSSSESDESEGMPGEDGRSSSSSDEDSGWVVLTSAIKTNTKFMDERTKESVNKSTDEPTNERLYTHTNERAKASQQRKQTKQSERTNDELK